MTIINSEKCTIIQGSEFGLPCNLLGGPGVRPFGTIHLENRRNHSSEYDSSAELCMKISNSKLLDSDDKCIFSTEELNKIKKFVSQNKELLKDFNKGYLTGKGFLHTLRKKYAYKGNSISWKELVFVQYDIPLYVSYWAKDYTIKYKSKFGILKYGMHMLYMMPKAYTQESIIEICKAQWPCLIKAESYIEKNYALLETEILKLKESNPDSIFSLTHEWVSKNITEDHISQIIKNYLTDRVNNQLEK